MRFIVADDQVPIFTHCSLRFAHSHLSIVLSSISSLLTSLNARNFGSCYYSLGTTSKNL
jgi:hypothetical protein